MKQPDLERLEPSVGYEATARWYDIWYDRAEKSDLADLIERHAGQVLGLEDLRQDETRILDLAAGTGNPYIEARRRGWAIRSSDGSAGMLDHALENARRAGVETDGLVLEPLRWTDRGELRSRFGQEEADIVVCLGNSFCHLPPADRVGALRNFRTLTRSGGLLLVDTKRFVKTDEGWLNEVSLSSPAKEIRVEREEQVARHGRTLHFHSRIFHDLAPGIGARPQRTIILVTVYDGSGMLDSFPLIYYPLPAATLHQEMERAGFRAEIIEGGDGGWRYDLVRGIAV